MNMTKDDEPSVITQAQLNRLIASMADSYSGEKIERALKAAFGSHLGTSSLSFLERNAIHHGILDIVKNSQSKDEIGKNIADTIDAVIASKLQIFKEVLYADGPGTDENKSLSVGLIRRSES